MRASAFRSAFLVALVALVGCAKTIPNTTVPDTPDNRQVIEFMERYRHAVEARNVGAILALIAPRYLDSVGTPTGDDDLDASALPERLAAWAARVNDVRYEIRYRKVWYERDRVYVEYTYTASFRMADADGQQRWRNVVRDARAELVHPDPDAPILFLSGL